MPIAELVGAPIPITINGERAELPVLTLYEVALAEAPYLASLERRAHYKSLVRGPDAVLEAETEVAEKSIALMEASTPILAWLTSNLEGTLFGIHACLESRYPGKFDIRDVAAWYHKRPKGDDDPVRKWLIGSKLIKNPTKRPSDENEDGQTNKRTDQ